MMWDEWTESIGAFSYHEVMAVIDRRSIAAFLIHRKDHAGLNL